MYSQKRRCGLTLLILVAIFFSGCLGTSKISVKSMETIEMEVDEEQKIEIKTEPEGITLDVGSIENAIVDVEANGNAVTVKALGEGLTIIYLIAEKPGYKGTTIPLRISIGPSEDPVMSFFPVDLPSGKEDQDYLFTFPLPEFDLPLYTVSEGSLPLGLDLTSDEFGELSIFGSPEEVGEFYFTLTISDNFDPDLLIKQEYILNILPVLSLKATVDRETIFAGQEFTLTVELNTTDDSVADGEYQVMVTSDQDGLIFQAENHPFIFGSAEFSFAEKLTTAGEHLLTIEVEDYVDVFEMTVSATEPAELFFLEGDGTYASPYLITNLYGLNAIRHDKNGYYVLVNDLDASVTKEPGSSYWNDTAGWEPILDFAGNLDGQGYLITDLFINRAQSNNVGIFASNTGSIANLSVVDADITGNNNVGVLVGQNAGQITEATVEGGSIQGSTTIGGLVGRNSGRITSSQALTDVSGDSEVGGLVGQNSGRVDQSFAHSNTIAFGARAYAGGLVGNNRGTINRSYSRGLVEGSSVGGLVGHNQNSNNGIITESYAATQIRGLGTGNPGGLASLNLGTIQNSYYDAELAGVTFGPGLQKTTNEMQEQKTYVNWDFTHIWDLDEAINDGYPYLRD